MTGNTTSEPVNSYHLLPSMVLSIARMVKKDLGSLAETVGFSVTVSADMAVRQERRNRTVLDQRI